MSYTVLARRYRSETFDDVVGQEAVARTLKNAIDTDRVAHAYLFTGTRGVGKTSMARILAKALNCLNSDKPTPQPCCKCDSCIAVNEGEDIDVLEIDGASNTGVDHIRELRQNAIYRPARGRFKIYIIDEVHMLSTGAFNALLKTLEEPPEHVKFIMATTEANKVPPTILSRCQRFDFRNIQNEDIAGHLQKIIADEHVEVEDVLIKRIARLGRGSMRDALSLLDQILSMSDGKVTSAMLDELLGTPRLEHIIELVEAIGRNDLSGSLVQIDRALSEGLALEQLSQSLQGHFRDLLVIRNCGAETELVDLSDKAMREKMVEQSQLFDDAALVYNITVTEELHRAIKSSGSGRALLEAAIVRLAANERFSDTKVLLEQLQAMQSGNMTEKRTTTPQRPAPAANNARPRPAPQGSSGREGGSPASVKSETVSKTVGDEKPAETGAKQTGSRFSPAKLLSLDFLRQSWQGIMEELEARGQKNLTMFLKLSQPAAWLDGTLTVGFGPAQDGMRSLLQDRPDQIAEIEKALTALLEHPVRLLLAEAAPTTETTAPPAESIAKTTTETSSPAQKTKTPPGAKPSQKEITEAMNEPQVKEVQKILGGKLRHIERGKSG